MQAATTRCSPVAQPVGYLGLKNSVNVSVFRESVGTAQQERSDADSSSSWSTYSFRNTFRCPLLMPIKTLYLKDGKSIELLNPFLEKLMWKVLSWIRNLKNFTRYCLFFELFPHHQCHFFSPHVCGIFFIFRESRLNNIAIWNEKVVQKHECIRYTFANQKCTTS